MLTGYYRKNKERLQKEAREIYQIFPEEEKNKKHPYGRNFPKDKKQRLVECRKNYSKIQKIKTG